MEVEAGSPVERFLSIYSPVDASWGEPGVDLPSPSQARALYRSLVLLRRRLGLEEGRRRVPRRRGMIDFRRSMRRSLRTFGETVRLARSSRKRSKTDILVLLDVSNSMKDYWPWILGILNSLRRYRRAATRLSSSAPGSLEPPLWWRQPGGLRTSGGLYPAWKAYGGAAPG